ncbi:hypothetical protein MTR67_040933 [Solanum verrucosum]|uniref:Uncharacterized protein n=1 Tax=Solanum verrucosum TaxID=315347 RepID=A0AAF0ULB8_SOLVR|nr:hypothetical protein MTR67_040933 [Solanum verrucosum]
MGGGGTKVESNSWLVDDRWVLETQTHQIAALKENQMENLKVALKIGAEHDTQKKQHDTLAHFEEGEVNDLAKEKVEGKRHKKKEKRRGRDDSSNIDNSEIHAKESKKTRKKAHASSDSDTKEKRHVAENKYDDGRDAKKKTSQRGRRYDSDEDDHDNDRDVMNKMIQKEKRHVAEDKYDDGRDTRNKTS